MHLVLEVDDPDNTLTADAKADMIDRVDRIIRTRIDEFGVEEPLIQKVGNDRLIVELAGVSNEEQAKNIIQTAAFLEFKLVEPTTDIESALSRIDRTIVGTLGVDSIRALGRDVESGGQGDLEQLLFGDSASADTTAAGRARLGRRRAGGQRRRAERAAAVLLAPLRRRRLRLVPRPGGGRARGRAVPGHAGSTAGDAAGPGAPVGQRRGGTRCAQLQAPLRADGQGVHHRRVSRERHRRDATRSSTSRRSSSSSRGRGEGSSSASPASTSGTTWRSSSTTRS